MSYVQNGLTGPVAEQIRAVGAAAGWSLEAVGAARSDYVGKKLVEVAKKEGFACLPEHEDVEIISLDQVNDTGSPVVISSLRSEDELLHADKHAEGRLYTTNASPLRPRPDVGLTNVYTNRGQINEAFDEKNGGQIIAGGNCTSIIICTGMAALQREIGLEFMGIKTLQGWSDAGLKAIPPENIGMPPIRMDNEEAKKIESEPLKLLSDSRRRMERILIDAVPNRAPWLVGHFALIKAQFERPTSRDEINELWRQYNAPDCFANPGSGLLPQPKPVEVLDEQTPFYGSGPGGQDILKVQHPMRVKAKVFKVKESDPRVALIGVSGDNLNLGAAGANWGNILYAQAHGYLK
jgi:aspartate-semialdehyde dehydrogenase